MSERPKCIGLIGKLFGHKFIKTVDNYIYRSSACYRCGYVVTHMHSTASRG